MPILTSSLVTFASIIILNVASARDVAEAALEWAWFAEPALPQRSLRTPKFGARLLARDTLKTENLSSQPLEDLPTCEYDPCVVS